MSRLSKGITGLSSYSRHGASQSQSVANDRSTNKSFEDLKRLIHGKLVDKLDLSRVSDLQGDTLRREIRLVVERLCDTGTGSHVVAQFISGAKMPFFIAKIEIGVN